MENQNSNVTNQIDLQTRFVQQTLKSGRFFLLFSIPPMTWVIFADPLVFPRIFIALLCGIVWFGCWRIWLDEHYFMLMSEENNHLAGEALFAIWRREKLQKLAFVERQRGALNLYRRTMWSTGVLWMTWLMALLWDYVASSSSGIL